MSETNLSRQTALCIGLAARELENTDAARLLKVLAEVTGLPPDAQKLSALKPGQLRTAAGGEFADQEQAALKAACTILRGDQAQAPDVPQPEAYAEGDMPDSIRVACASDSGERIDGHFGSCRYFLIYQVSAEELRLVDVRPSDHPVSVEDKNAWRAGLIADAQVLFVASIGGPAAAKVVRASVHPIKVPQGGEAREKLRELQLTLAAAPPPWLAKAMGHAAEARIRFPRDDREG